MPAHWTSYILILFVLALAIRRNMRGRKLRMETLWVLPAVMVAVVGFILAVSPPPPLTVDAGLALALLIGCAIGWQRGRFTRIALDPATHSFTSQASPAGMIFLLVLFVVRFGLRAYVTQSARAAGLAIAATDGFMLLALGAIVTQRVEMGLRCRKMLADSKAARPAP